MAIRRRRRMERWGELSGRMRDEAKEFMDKRRQHSRNSRVVGNMHN